MATAITPLANITLGSSASTVTFSSISGSYRDLMLVVNAGAVNTGGQSASFKLNGDAGSNYNWVRMMGDGSTASSDVSASTSLIYLTGAVWVDQAITFNSTIHLLDYSATDKHKSIISRANNSAWGTNAIASRWASTAAISSIVLTAGSGWLAGSTFALYGVSA